MAPKTNSKPEAPIYRHLITRFFRGALALAFLLSLISGAAALFFIKTPVSPQTDSLVIARGASLQQIARRLEEGGIVGSSQGFRLLAIWRGDSGRIQAGDYQFDSPATPTHILDRLVAGDVRRWPLTIPEGLRLTQIATLFDENSLASGSEILTLAGNQDFIARLGIDAPSLEGYLFPETYHFVRGTTPEKLLRTLVRQMKQKLTAEVLEQAQRLELNRHQLLTLASIIQKEAGSEEEMPLIAAVFHNRLKKRMRLQTDPTVIYGIANFDGNLTRKHLRTPGPYNSYRNPGLPPGPIASPGEAAILAAANPASVDYLYFVSRGDGTHVFSRTLKEHNASVRKYQLHR